MVRKPRRRDGTVSMDIKVFDGVMPVLERKEIPRSEWDEVMETLKRKL